MVRMHHLRAASAAVSSIAGGPRGGRRAVRSGASGFLLKDMPRKEIDRNYFLGDIFIKTGVAVTVALCMIALYTPFTFRQAKSLLQD